MIGVTGVPILTQSEMLEFESNLIHQSCDQGESLMRQAGADAAQFFWEEFGAAGAASNPLRVGLICGWGNNGGDGFVMARLLSEREALQVTVFQVNPQRRVSVIAEKMRHELPARVKVVDLAAGMALESCFRDIDVIVDGLFGIGLNRRVEEFESHLIDRINQLSQMHVPVVSLDLPSGLNATTGATWGNVIKADLTVTFGAMKSGLWMGEGLEARGRLKLSSSGFPGQEARVAAKSFLGYGLREVEEMLPLRGVRSHKYSNGKVLILGGSAGMWGAAILSAMGALRAGAGHVTVASFDSPAEILGVLPEVLLIDLAAGEVDWSSYDAILVGPGLVESEKLVGVLKELMARQISKVILDAGALSALGTLLRERPEIKVPSDWILTPHEGEAGRLVRKVLGSRETSAGGPLDLRWTLYEQLREFVAANVILKGPKSWIFRSKLRPVSIALTGNDVLAKAGSGDVLAGVVLTFLAQMEVSSDAALLGCVIHGAAGDLWATQHGRRSLLISELPGLVGEVLFAMENSKV